MFLAFQYPTAIPGLSVASFIRSALNAKLQGIDKNADVDPTDPMKGGISMRDFRRKMREKFALLKMDESFATRYVNDGFSGGEKKRLEMLQMAMLEPEMAILDETDSGLDIDALRIVAEGVNAMLNPNIGILLITHYQRLLNYITPDVVHVLAARPDREDAAARTSRCGSRTRATARSSARPASRPTCPTRRSRCRRSPVGSRPHDDRPTDRDGRARPTTRDRTADPPAAPAATARPLDPEASLRADFPILATRVQRPAAGLPRLGVDPPEAARRSSTRSTTSTASTTPTSIAGSTRSASERRRPTRRRAPRSRRSSTRRIPRDRLHAQRDRGDQPRRVLLGPQEHRRAATRSS